MGVYHEGFGWPPSCCTNSFLPPIVWVKTSTDSFPFDAKVNGLQVNIWGGGTLQNDVMDKWFVEIAST